VYKQCIHRFIPSHQVGEKSKIYLSVFSSLLAEHLQLIILSMQLIHMVTLQKDEPGKSLHIAIHITKQLGKKTLKLKLVYQRTR